MLLKQVHAHTHHIPGDPITGECREIKAIMLFKEKTHNKNDKAKKINSQQIKRLMDRNELL